MSQEENKSIHRHFYEQVINSKDLEAVDRFVSPNYLGHGLSSELLGREGLKALVRTFLAAFPDASVTVEDQVADGNEVISRLIFRGTQMAQFQGIPPLGQPVTVQVVDIARFQDGKCVERWGGLDQFSFWQQLGIVRPPARSSLSPALGTD